MKILVINCGSSSIKYKLFDKEKVLTSGYIERIGIEDSGIKDHSHGIKLMFENILKSSAVKNLDEISAVGHRVVHGGEMSKPSIVNEGVLKVIKKYSEAAPLHNPAELKGIFAVQKHLPKIKNVAVFDTAFHRAMPEYASTYAIPYKYCEEGIKRYGFHGISHEYVCKRASEMLKKPFESLKLISCHLGAGCSITAVKNGKSIDTSMGFTPLEGLVMGTRCGDIDAGLLLFLMKKHKMKPGHVDEMLNNKSGILGISGKGPDFRDITEGMKKGDKKCKLAFDIFCYRIKKYLGAYSAALDGADAVIFTGGIGENNAMVRKNTADIQAFGIRLDENKNNEVFSYMAAKDQKYKKEGIISAPDSKVKILVIPADEELMIAKETGMIVKN